MNTYIIIQCVFGAIFIPIIVSASVCPMGATFPEWMTGYFHAEFADGSSANARFGRWYANVTFSTGENGTLTMTEPLRQGDDFYVFHECVQIYDTEPALRCSLLVRNGTGYIEYIHKDPELIPICPKSISSAGLEMEIVTRID
ncbi:unnamed protein product [Adineta steineri]|uniref:Uncharacterized protein n=2 Tax=Adineta steineri TaxID=433720 RepID=A0A818Y2E5_9BILA|nr:unnamed protein product [Adineta steineri]CAF3745356.1 unnamed protein product [Adineta steineri]